MAKRIVRYLLAFGMMAIGLTHFIDPAPFVRIVPKVLPWPYFLVYASGFFEILGGMGLLWQRTRLWASVGLIALYLAVFPANINMAINEVQVSAGGTMPVWAMWARLPLQAGLIALAFWVGRPERDTRTGASR